MSRKYRLTSVQTFCGLFFIKVHVDCLLSLGRVLGLTATTELGQNSGRKENVNKLKSMDHLMTDSMKTQCSVM